MSLTMPTSSLPSAASIVPAATLKPFSFLRSFSIDALDIGGDPRRAPEWRASDAGSERPIEQGKSCARRLVGLHDTLHHAVIRHHVVVHHFDVLGVDLPCLSNFVLPHRIVIFRAFGRGNHAISVGIHFFMSTIAVSYTHLRAHETGRNLVCRL